MCPEESLHEATSGSTKPVACRCRPGLPGGRSIGTLVGRDLVHDTLSAGSVDSMLHSMPAAVDAARAAAAHGRQGVGDDHNPGFQLTGGAGPVPGQAATAMTPSEKAVDGAAAAWRWMDAGWTLRGKILRCRSQLAGGTNGAAGTALVGGAAVWLISACRSV